MRIITAREQMEMLAPWRVGGTGESPMLHRIMELGYPGNTGVESPPSWSRIPELLKHDPGNELGPTSLNGLTKGVGKHWSHNLDFARDKYWGGRPPVVGDFQVVLSADHPGVEQESGHWNEENRETHPEEEEFTAPDATPMTVRQMLIKTKSDNNWRSVPLTKPWQGISTTENHHEDHYAPSEEDEDVCDECGEPIDYGAPLDEQHDPSCSLFEGH